MADLAPVRPKRRIPPLVWILSGLLGLLALVVLFGGWQGYLKIMVLSGRVATLEAQIATTTDKLQEGLAQASSTITAALAQQQQDASSLRTQFGTITSSVNQLEKLAKLDPELLKKYSKVYFLNENYVPAQLSTIPREFDYHDDRDYSALTPVMPFLTSMLLDAKQNTVPIYVESSYRSFGEQQSLKGSYAVVYGAGTANSFSADQGYSEHQLGTTFDFITTGLNGQLAGFDKTAAYDWLTQNAYRYGFILSYPAGNSYYIYEPWHWRFVGIKLATYLHDNHLNFYDVDQRTIDGYLAGIFDQASYIMEDN